MQGTVRRRIIAIAAALVLVAAAVAACDGGAAPRTTGPSGTGDPPPTTAGTTPTTPPPQTTTTAPAAPDPLVPGAFPIDYLPPIEGEAPLRLAGVDPGVISAVAYPPSTPFREALEPPAGFGLEIDSCTRPAPGVLLVEGDSTADAGVTFPFTTRIYASTRVDDVGTGIVGLVTFDGPGRFALELSSVGARAAEEAAGRIDFDFLDRFRADRSRGRWASGMCSLEAGRRAVVTGEIPVEVVTGALDVTAPDGTIEALAQTLAAEGSDAVLFPLVKLYGEARHFYADRWFLPDDAGLLLEVDEDLDKNRCLQLEMEFEAATILQERGCALPARGGVYGAGDRWTAVASDGEWLVRVIGNSRDGVERIARSLTPYRHLFATDLPIQPVGEVLVGRAPFRDGEVLVTLGPPCDDCGDEPRRWFRVYRVTTDGLDANSDGLDVDSDGLDPFAIYPGQGGCGVFVEDEFILAVATSRGLIEIDLGDGPELRDAPSGDRPLAFIDRADHPDATAKPIARNGTVQACVARNAEGGRGGIQSFTYETPAPYPTLPAGRVVDVVACDAPPDLLPEMFADVVLQSACADTVAGDLVVSHTGPPQIGPTAPGIAECLVVSDGERIVGGPECTGPDPESIVSRDGGGGFVRISVLAPEGTTRVTAITIEGVEVTAVPVERLAVLWIEPSVEGALMAVVADTAGGVVTLWPRR